MEVSSQGLMMDRVAGIHYDIGVFTNLSPDHIGPGEHKTFEEYRSWKGQLFKRCTTGVVNIDDENTEALLEGHTCKLVTYGCSEKADYRAGTYQLLRTHDFLGVRFHVSGKDDMDVKVNMPGEFSVYNALAALTVGKVLGLPDEAIHEGLSRCVVKGRVELVPISRKFTILLDYAHNEVSTESLLTTLRAYEPHRLVVVFGCGGNRSKLRRYGMGEICARMADFSILTEDNNRFEKVEDILADIRVGMNKATRTQSSWRSPTASTPCIMLLTTHRRATSSPSSARVMRLTVTARASRPPSSSGSCWKNTPGRSALSNI